MRTMIKGAALIGASLVLAHPAAAAEAGVVYVPEGSANAILVLDPASGDVVRRIDGVPEVHGLAAGPMGDFLVAGSFAESPPGEAPPKSEGVSADEHAAHHGGGASAQGASQAVSYVSIIRPEDGTITRRIEVPGAVQTLFVSAREANEVVAIDLPSGAVTRQPLGPQPYHLTAGSGDIYVTSAEEPKLWVLDAGSLEVMREVPLQDIGHQVVVAVEPAA